MTIRSLGLLDSLRFIYDVPAFLTAGRKLGPVWRFWFPGTGQRLTVVSDPRLAESALQTCGLDFYRGDALAPWLGELSPLLTSGNMHDTARAQAQLVLQRRANRVDPRPIIHAALQSTTDAARALHEAAVDWAVALVIGPSTQQAHTELVEAVHAWLAAAEGPALVMPALRRWSATWAGLADARARLEQCIRYSLAVDDDETVHAVLTLLAGAIDNPALLAAEALTHLHRDDLSTTAIVQAARMQPPVPLVFRSTLRELRLLDYNQGKMLEVEVAPGEGFAVDLAGAGLPFGTGEHACLGMRPAMEFATAAVEVARYLRLVPVSPPQRRRVRLSWGVTRLELGQRKISTRL